VPTLDSWPVKLNVTTSDGQTRDVVGIEDAEAWMRTFQARGTSQLGDWLEVVPHAGHRRTFVRATAVVSVQLIEDEEVVPLTVHPET
jgi:hypothetical protein